MKRKSCTLTASITKHSAIPFAFKFCYISIFLDALSYSFPPQYTELHDFLILPTLPMRAQRSTSIVQSIAMQGEISKEWEGILTVATSYFNITPL